MGASTPQTPSFIPALDFERIKAGMIKVDPAAATALDNTLRALATALSQFMLNTPKGFAFTGPWGAHDYLQQLTPGGPVTAAQPSTGDLSDYSVGTWTPADASGAGLVFTVTFANYIRVGKLVFINALFTYPSTANGSNALIGGLPFTVGAGAGQGQLMSAWSGGYGSSLNAEVIGNTTHFEFLDLVASANSTNANLSTRNVIISGCYQAA